MIARRVINRGRMNGKGKRGLTMKKKRRRKKCSRSYSQSSYKFLGYIFHNN